LLNPTTYITHQVNLEEVKAEFANWLDPKNGVVKAMVKLGD
jgi:hypothetical protein